MTFETLRGGDVAPDLWRTVFGFSEQTFLRHGNAHYLSAEFLGLVAGRMPDAIMVKLARLAGEPVAAAIFFQDDRCCTAATGAPPGESTACTSRPATTRASSGASSAGSTASSRAPRASTSSRAASSRR